jgi:hypothetical protein
MCITKAVRNAILRGWGSFTSCVMLEGGAVELASLCHKAVELTTAKTSVSQPLSDRDPVYIYIFFHKTRARSQQIYS